MKKIQELDRSKLTTEQKIGLLYCANVSANNKENIDYVIWGNGNPLWGDPRDVFQRMFSKHIVLLCHKKPMSAPNIAAPKTINSPLFGIYIMLR